MKFSFIIKLWNLEKIINLKMIDNLLQINWFSPVFWMILEAFAYRQICIRLNIARDRFIQVEVGSDVCTSVQTLSAARIRRVCYCLIFKSEADALLSKPQHINFPRNQILYSSSISSNNRLSLSQKKKKEKNHILHGYLTSNNSIQKKNHPTKLFSNLWKGTKNWI